MPALLEQAARNKVAVGQQDREVCPVGDQGGGKAGHDIRAVGVEGDLAETLRLALGAEDAAGEVEPLERRIGGGIDLRLHLQNEARRHRRDRQRFPGDGEFLGGQLASVKPQRTELQLTSVEEKGRGGIGGRMAPILLPGENPGGMCLQIDMQVNGIDQVARGAIIVQMDGAGLIHSGASERRC